jgi:hypothetical protein
MSEAGFHFGGEKMSGSAEISGTFDSLRVDLPAGTGEVLLTGGGRVLAAYTAGYTALNAADFECQYAYVHQAAVRDLHFHATTYAYVAVNGPADVVLHGEWPEELTVVIGGTGELVAAE